MTADTGDYVTVGRVGPAHGVRGDVFVAPWTDDPDERFRPGAVLVTDPASGAALTVGSSRWHSGRLVVRFAGIDDRTTAQALRGTLLLIAAADRPPLDDPDEFYDSDLVGLAARTVDGRALGPVRDVVHAAAASYLVVEVAGQERLVPFVAAVVPKVDVAGGTVVVDPPEGLFDL